MNGRNGGMARRARIASLTLLVWAAGCIEYFAEPPDLGAIPAVDAAIDAAADGVLPVGAGDAGADTGRHTDDASDASPDACAPQAETCDGIDNDCDGTTDEDPGAALCRRPRNNPDTADAICRDGECALACYAGRHDIDREYENGCEYGPCSPFDPPGEATEECNGQDDDCDGHTDEAAGLIPPLAEEQRGVCSGVGQICTGADWRQPRSGEIAGYEADETRCDGLDNDCDGTTDEGIPGCDVGCDGIDDDGDGRSDESCAEVRCGAERAGVAVPPCNGCPDRTVVPAGWVCIPPGVFTMGSPPDDDERFAQERPQWPVELTGPLLMQATEVTQGEWRALMGNNPSWFQPNNPLWLQPCDPAELAAADACPVETVNWWEAVEYTNRASLRDGLTPCHEPLSGCGGEPGEGMQCDDEVERVPECEGYRLPTEAEWEYAARAGTVGRWSSGDDEAALAAVAWYGATSGDHPHPVGRLGANAWGLFDVHGNVWEWAWDWYGAYPAEPPAAPVADPAGPPAASGNRVHRNGSWDDAARYARSAYRNGGHPSVRSRRLGFRLVRAPARRP